MSKIIIDSIIISHLVDSNPDISFIGEYTDKLKAGVIVRKYGEYFERLPEDAEIPQPSREFRGFIPYAAGKPKGTEEYYEYGLHDFKRMEELNSGNFSIVGIVASAQVKYKEGDHFRFEWLKSGGLWGIESDSGSYIQEVEEEQLADLKGHLLAFGVDVSNFDRLAQKTKDSGKR